MIFRTATPEACGVSSAAVERYLRTLEDAHLYTHNVLLARGNRIFHETYVPPFYKERLHRMYSVSKSMVSLAVGCALDDGLLSLDDPMEKFFANELANQPCEKLHKQTVRNMLMMATCNMEESWFSMRADDRVRAYFESPRHRDRTPGAEFEYDSTGTFILGALVERLTGEKFMDYLRRKVFDKIGVSPEAHCLTCPGGHSWGDSACLMTPRDLLTVARFVANGGKENGEQLISAAYIHDATAALIPNDTGRGSVTDTGYGYYIWKMPRNGFLFNGMGCQFAAYDPTSDILLVYNGDNQGKDDMAYEIVLRTFLDVIAVPAGKPLANNPAAEKSLTQYAASLRLNGTWGDADAPLLDVINEKTYTLSENPMGIRRLSLTFDRAKCEGVFAYENAQGNKRFSFGLSENRFGKFPQTGYSTDVGSVRWENVKNPRLYGCAASASFTAPDTLWMKVQLIDDYFGNMDAYFRFSADGKTLSLSMRKTAEDFLDEYAGDATGTADA